MTDLKPVTHEQAKESVQRLVDKAFGNKGERPRFSIPANHARDDDLLLIRYIEEQQACHPDTRAAVVEEQAETELIKQRDEAEEAMQWLDVETGGTGEYRYSTIDANAPSTPRKMAEGIAGRFSALTDTPQAEKEEVEGD